MEFPQTNTIPGVFSLRLLRFFKIKEARMSLTVTLPLLVVNAYNYEISEQLQNLHSLDFLSKNSPSQLNAIKSSPAGIRVYQFCGAA